jgi:hypothetical protein
MGRVYLSIAILGLVSAGCGDRKEADSSGTGGGITTSAGSATSATDAGTDSDSSASSDSDSSGGNEKFDVAMDTNGMLPCEEGGWCPECELPEHTPCDQNSSDVFNAMGINCPNELMVTNSVDGNPDAMGVRSFFGNTNEWNPTEGSYMAVLGSGLVAELDLATPAGDSDIGPTYCNDDLGAFDPGANLPAPLNPVDVGGDCTTNAALLGTGDCSNTIQAQFDQGGSANDYTEMRFTAQVPSDTSSFSYDLAFFSTEYPFYYDTAFNDMYVGWLQAESWTGNISFDEQGNPISLNAGFLDFTDDGGGLPEFAGTCMRQHAGTKWLTTTAPVTPGDSIEVVFAIFDLSDSILDSYVFLDNFQWGCEGPDKPSTKPVG